MNSSYNGFTASERSRAEVIIRRGLKAGKIKPETACRLCGLAARAHLMWHLEDYADPMHPIRICVECHMRLHRRFKQPNRWKAHCLIIRSGPARAFPSVSAFFAASAGERADIGPIAFEPNPERWWENLLFEPIDLRRQVSLV